MGFSQIPVQRPELGLGNRGSGTDYGIGYFQACLSTNHRCHNSDLLIYIVNPVHCFIYSLHHMFQRCQSLRGCVSQGFRQRDGRNAVIIILSVHETSYNFKIRISFVIYGDQDGRVESHSPHASALSTSQSRSSNIPLPAPNKLIIGFSG